MLGIQETPQAEMNELLIPYEDFKRRYHTPDRVVIFMAAFCGHCRRLMPKIQRLMAELQSQYKNRIPLYTVEGTKNPEMTAFPTVQVERSGESWQLSNPHDIEEIRRWVIDSMARSGRARPKSQPVSQQYESQEGEEEEEIPQESEESEQSASEGESETEGESESEGESETESIEGEGEEEQKILSILQSLGQQPSTEQEQEQEQPSAQQAYEEGYKAGVRNLLDIIRQQQSQSQ